MGFRKFILKSIWQQNMFLSSENLTYQISLKLIKNLELQANKIEILHVLHKKRIARFF